MDTLSAPLPGGSEPTRVAAGAGGPSARPPRAPARIKVVPPDRGLRERLRDRCRELAAGLDKTCPMGRDQMETFSRSILAELGLPEGYVGWTMVMLASAFWHDQVAATPASRRLCLLPHCLRHAESCPGVYDETGLDCGDCRACSIADYRTAAEQLGYRVLVAEGSPVVMKIIVSGEVDALVGVACLNVLEKSLDKILLAGIPCMAVPLLSSDCRNTSVDGDWIHEMLNVRRAEPVTATRTYVHLLRVASRMCQSEQLERLAPRARGHGRRERAGERPAAGHDPIAGTEAIAYEFLARGGKYSRPFITLAVHDALTGGRGTHPDGERHLARLPESILRTALSIECFHKASLVHDDIEDDDAFRYGEQTLHRQHGVPAAINVGDYLIGLGYRLISREPARLGAETTVDLLHCLAEAHTRLCEGQGAELLWRNGANKRLLTLEALKIYALKTAPAFEAALFCGARLAGPAEAYAEPFRQFARNLGVAFQILNDLKDWQENDGNKLVRGSDVLGGRPTVLLALALESLPPAEQAELMVLIDAHGQPDAWRLERIGQLYRVAEVQEKARRLVEKHQQRASAVANAADPPELRRLLHYLIDSVLERPAREPSAQVVTDIATPWSPTVPS